MAGDWIKMRIDLRSNPKVVRMASALKADRLRTVGGLYSAWCLFDVHSVDGFMEGYTLELLDEEIGIPGFAEAMKSVGWLAETAQGIEMPRFDTHNGQSAKRRAQDADRKREERKILNPSADEADKKRTREEKRREEKRRNSEESGDEFRIDLSWRPSDDAYELIKIGCGRLPAQDVINKHLANFIGYWKDEGSTFRQDRWDHKFAEWVNKKFLEQAKQPGRAEEIYINVLGQQIDTADPAWIEVFKKDNDQHTPERFRIDWPTTRAARKQVTA